MFDLVIKNALICDGTGQSSYPADIAVSGDRIVRIGTVSVAEAEKVIDARGLTVTPGFIDPHTHVDQSVLMAPQMEPYLKQGVTTVVTGNCGYGMAPQGENTYYCSDMDLEFLEKAGADDSDALPLIFEKDRAKKALRQRYDISLDWQTFEEFNRKCDSLPLGCNMAPLIGYSALRTAVMGKDCLREATEKELDALEAEVRKAMEAGAFGLSSGRDPVYLPGPYAADAEMHRVLQAVADYDGIFASHTHNCDQSGNPDRMGGYEEMLRQAEGLDLKLNISHVHVVGMAENGEEAEKAAEKTISWLEEMRKNGRDVTCDVIPSAACADFTMTSIGYFIKPLILMAGTRQKLAELFRTEDFRKKVHEMIADGQLPTLDETSDVCWLPELYILKHSNASYQGKLLAACAEELNMTLIDTVMKLFAEDPDMAADMIMPDFDGAVDLLCRWEHAMPCSDGSSFAKETNLTGNDEMPLYPNSMNISYMPRYLLRYGSGEAGIFEQAVHKASGLVARRFAIDGRGVIKEGNFADLVILNREKLRSFDEEENPLQDPLGIEYVIVNGKTALAEGGLTGVFAGRALRKEKK